MVLLGNLIHFSLATAAWGLWFLQMEQKITDDFRLGKVCRMLLAGLAIGVLMTSAMGNIAYLTCEDNVPWGVGRADPSSNEAAMDRVFGDDGWDELSFQNADASVLFSSSYTFIFLEGGDHAAFSLEGFLMANGSLIEDWVRNGGRLLINAAPNQGTGMDLGFGLTLNYNYDGPGRTWSSNAYIADEKLSLVDGNYGNAGGTFTGNWFSHATVSGDGLNSLIVGDVGVILGEMPFGEGSVMVGGMTLAYYHAGSDGTKERAYDLRANLIDYAVHGAIPEPSVYARWGAAGLAGLIIVRRRRK